jgi:methyltransferase (TIGR00027 family)
VRDAKPSRTAQGVAAERAALTGMGVLADPFAGGMVPRWMRAAFWVAQRCPYQLPARSLTLAGLAARVLWFDAQVVAALDAGIGQIAVIGAGYDSRAWRLGRDGVRFFELDHRATQHDKMRRAPRPGPTYVEADLTTQSAADALQNHGLDASRPALLVVEGVTMYLDEKIVRRQLCELAASSATGTRLAADFHPPRDTGTSRNRRQARFQQLFRTGSGETLELLVEPREAAALVETTGWRVTEAASLRDVARTLVPRTSGLPVDAVNEHKSLVAAMRG